MSYIKKVVIVMAFSFSTSTISLSSNGHNEEGQLSAQAAKTQAPTSELKPLPSLQYKSMQAATDQERFALAEKIPGLRDLYLDDFAFKKEDIRAFARQAVAPELHQEFTESYVVNYFGLETPEGKMRFRKAYGADLPTLIKSGQFAEIFDRTYMETLRFVNKLRKEEDDDENDVKLEWLDFSPESLVKDIGYRFPKDYLAQHPLKAIPIEIHSFEGLKHLRVAHGDLRVLPIDLGDSENLEDLRLEKNPKLSTIPESVTKLKKLRLLDLTGDPITKLPNGLEHEGLKIEGYK